MVYHVPPRWVSRPVSRARSSTLGQVFLGLALEFGQGVVADFAHQLEGIHIHGALEQVQQGDDGEFVVLEGVAEAVVERGAEGFVAALLSSASSMACSPLRMACDEVLDLLLAAQPHLDGLADDHAEGQGVAVAVVEQRLPVGDFRAGDLLLRAEA